MKMLRKVSYVTKKLREIEQKDFCTLENIDVHENVLLLIFSNECWLWFSACFTTDVLFSICHAL